MSNYWNITKKYPSHTEKFKLGDSFIDLDDWKKIVNSDEELLWFLDSKYALDGEGKVSERRRKKNKYATTLFIKNNKIRPGNLQFKFLAGENYLFCTSERITVEQIQKMYEVAKKLGAVLFNNTKAVEGKYLEKLIERYTPKSKRK